MSPASQVKAPNQKQQLLPLTAMRFFLAMWVVIYHLASPGYTLDGWWSDLPHPLFLLLRGALVILDVFFISSGFILAYHYDLGSKWSARELWAYGIARFSRLYPLYALGILVMLPFELNYVLQEWSPMVAAKSAFKFLLVATMTQSWIPQAALAWNYPSWSLSADAFYYVLFPFAGVYVWRRLTSTKAVVLTILVLWACCLVPPSLAYLLDFPGFGRVPATAYVAVSETYLSSAAGGRNVVHEPIANSELLTNLIRYNPLFRLSEFLVGIVASRLYRRWSQKTHYLSGRGQLLYIPGLIVAFGMVLCGDRIPYPFLHNGLVLPAWMFVIIGFALGGGLLAKMLSWQPIVFLGAASYSIYLLHGPVQAWMVLALRGSASEGGLPESWSLVYLLTVVVIACLVYKYFEEPANRLLRSRLKRFGESRLAARDQRQAASALKKIPADNAAPAWGK